MANDADEVGNILRALHKRLDACASEIESGTLVTLSFRLPRDAAELKRALGGDALASVIWHVLEETIRPMEKWCRMPNGDPVHPEALPVLTAVRESIVSELLDRGFTPEQL
jgi:hypothetical protein